MQDLTWEQHKWHTRLLRCSRSWIHASSNSIIYILFSGNTRWVQRRAIIWYTLCANPSPPAIKDYITPSCLEKNVQAVCGAVAQRNACYHGCSAQPVHLNAQCQWCRKCRSAVSVLKEAGVCLCVVYNLLWGFNTTCLISLPSLLLTFALPRLLGRAGAEWEHRGSGRADQPANDTRCRPNKRKCWHESNSADIGSGAWEWWNPYRRTRACAVVLLYSQWRHGKDPLGCTAWIQPE